LDFRSITLFVLSEDKVDGKYSPFQKASYRVPNGSREQVEFVLSKSDLSKIDLRIGEIFQYEAWLTILKYDGKVSFLDRDLMISGSTPITEPTINVEVSLPPILVVLFILFGAVSTLAGV